MLAIVKHVCYCDVYLLIANKILQYESNSMMLKVFINYIVTGRLRLQDY